MSTTITLPPISHPSQSRSTHISFTPRPSSRPMQVSRPQSYSRGLVPPRRLPVILLDPQRLVSARKEKLDPMSLLHPGRKKLSTLEAQRVLGVAQAALARVELARALPQVWERLVGEAERLGEGELVALIEEHGALLEELNDLMVLSGMVSRARSNVSKSRSERISSRSPAGAVESSEGQSEGQVEGEGQTEGNVEGEIQVEGQHEGQIEGQDQGEGQTENQIEGQNEGQNALTNWPRSRQELNELDLISRIQDSCRNVMRAVARQPSVVKEILEWIRDEEEIENRDSLMQEMRDLRDFTLKNLLTSPYEMKIRVTHTKELEIRAAEHEELNERLEKELLDAEELRDKDIEEKNTIIRKLQSELSRIERQSDDKVRNLRLEGARNRSTEESASEGRCSILKGEVNQTRGQYNGVLSQHRDSEMLLRKRKFQVEVEIENLIQKYDQEMGDRQDEYDQIDFLYTEEKRQLEELEERFRVLEVEFNEIMGVRRAAREQREISERELLRAVRAATAIQAYWRSHKVRKAMKAKKRKAASGKKNKK